MPFFDIVSEVDSHELTNAIDEAKVESTNEGLLLQAQSEFQIQQIVDILYKKVAKRGIEISALESGHLEVQNLRARLPMKLKQGIDKEVAKKITKLIKDSKIKVQTAIQDQQVRVTGKKA
jgi:uncharacterized protein YajQ (UPF0234 family)